MDFRKPPALASWILERLGYTHENPALAGDLLEEFQSGRSPAWYWRQTLTVIVRAPGRNNFAWLSAKALLAGYVAQVAVVYCLWRFHTLPQVHGAVGWILASLLSALAWILAIFLRAVITGGRSSPPDLRRLLWSGYSHPRLLQLTYNKTDKLRLWTRGSLSPVRRVAAVGFFFQAFGEGVLVYCIAATFRPADFQPLGGVIGAQIGLLGLQVLRLFWVLTPIGIRFPRGRHG
jgi:hypothetical protein